MNLGVEHPRGLRGKLLDTVFHYSEYMIPGSFYQRHDPLVFPPSHIMRPFHPFVFAVTDIYGNPDYSYHLPWIFKLSLIGLGIRAFVWVLNKLPKENKSLRKPVRTSTAPSSPPRPTAPIPVVPAVAREILVLRGGGQLGPYTVEEINHQLSAHAFEFSDLAWHEGLAEWRPLSSIAGVMTSRGHHLHPPPPPVRTTN